MKKGKEYGSRSSSSSGSAGGSCIPPYPHIVPPLVSLYGEGLLSLLTQAQSGNLETLGLRCGLCLAVFPSPWLLDQHIGLQHPGSSTAGSISPHRHHHSLHHHNRLSETVTTEEKPFRCDQCGQSYRYRSAYIKHREQNHRARLPADKLFTCDVCGMQFRYLKSFKKHRLNHTVERLHTSSPRSTSSRQSISGEIKEEDISTVEEESNRITTEEGRVNEDEVTSSNEALRVRGEIEPAEQDDTIDSAEQGSDIGESLGNLGSGSGSSSSTPTGRPTRVPRSFACPFCGKCVRSKENLKLHVRKHTGERPFACLFCGRAFGGKSDLTRHLRIHTGERPYHCEMCGKCFARADYLSKHLTTHIHHGGGQR